MDKIINVALSNALNKIRVDNLLEVINATGNSRVATEILLGVYEEPIIAQTSKSSNEVRTMTRFDKFKEEVIYDYVRTSKRSNYFKTLEEADACTEYNPNGKTSLYGDDERNTYKFSKTFDYVSKGDSYCTLREWERGTK